MEGSQGFFPTIAWDMLQQQKKAFKPHYFPHSFWLNTFCYP